MRFSIITVVHNNRATISDCVRSVLSQRGCEVEYIVVDGASTDGTLDVLRGVADRARVVSEPDKGMYDALNKGLALATGEVVGLLHADDFYAHQDVLAKVAEAFAGEPVDSVFADLVYVRPDNPSKIVRYYSGAGFTLDKFSVGWMPPHPTFFARRECYQKYGGFKTDYRIAADYELMARFMVCNGITWRYLPEVVIKMRTGGMSTRGLMSNITLNREIRRACAENNIPTNYLKIYSKYLTKVGQLFARPA